MLFTVRPSFFSSSRIVAMMLAAMASATISGCPTLMLSDVICMCPPWWLGFSSGLRADPARPAGGHPESCSRVSPVSQLLIVFRRREHAARDDEFEGLLDGHLEVGDAVFRDDHVVARGRVRGRGDENVDASTAGLFPEFARGLPGHERHRVEALARELDEDHPFEALPLLADHGLDDLLDGLVDAPDERDPLDERFGKAEEPSSGVAGRDQARDEDQKDRRNGSKTADVEPEQGVRVDGDRDDPKQAVHQVDQEEQDVDRQPDGHGDGQAGQENVLDPVLHGGRASNKKKAKVRDALPGFATETPFALWLDPVPAVHMDALGAPALRLSVLDHDVARDDDQIPFGHLSRRGAVQADHAGALSALDDVRRKALAVRDVIDRHLLVRNEIGPLHEPLVDRDASLVVQVCVRHRRPMNLGLEQDALHGLSPSQNRCFPAPEVQTSKGSPKTELSMRRAAPTRTASAITHSPSRRAASFIVVVSQILT